MTEYEKTAIAAIKDDPEAYDAARLRWGDFSDGVGKRIFRAIETIIELGDPLDDMKIAELAGVDIGVVIGLEWRSSANIEFYAGEIKELARREKLRVLGLHLEAMLKDGKMSADILATIDKKVIEITDERGQGLRVAKDILRDYMTDLERWQAEGCGLRGLPSGFQSLDAMTGGFREGELIVISARTSAGKTALALTMIVAMCTEAEKRVGLFSAEMNERRVMARLVALTGRHPLRETNGDVMMTKRTIGKIAQTAQRLYHDRLVVNDTPGIAFDDLKPLARIMKRKGAEVIFVDYLTLIKHGDLRVPRHERVGEISKGLKQLARELEIPVVVLSQLNRQAEGHRPGLENLRQSGEIEEDADVIIMIEMDREASGDAREATLIMAKNRNGPTGDVPVVFMPQTTRFENIGGGGQNE